MGIFKVPGPSFAGGAQSPTGYVSGGLITASMMSNKENARFVDPYYYPPAAGIHFQYMACCTTPHVPTPWGPEIRCFNKPPQDYVGLSPLKIRYWGFFPDPSRSVFGITPSPEGLSFVTYAWWVPDAWNTNTDYPAGGTCSSFATYTATDEVMRHPLVSLVPDPAVPWSDSAMLYLYMNAGCPSTPNEFGLIACEVLYPV